MMLEGFSYMFGADNQTFTDTSRTIQFSGGSHSSGYGDKCCPPVVDPYTWLALIGGIALATFFLQQAIVMNIGRKKRSMSDDWGVTSKIDFRYL